MSIKDVIKNDNPNIHLRKAELLLSLESVRDELNKNPIKTAYEILKQIDESLPQSLGHIDCKMGCYFCCIQPVGVTLVEVMAILHHLITTKTKEELAELSVKLLNVVSEREKGNKIYCGFLENNLCSIYNIRPINCATYFSPDVNICIKNGGYALTAPDNRIDMVVNDTVTMFYEKLFNAEFDLNKSLGKLLAIENVADYNMQYILGVIST